MTCKTSLQVFEENCVVEIVEKGRKGDKGDAGQGVPAGGDDCQFLKKDSAADYDTVWSDITHHNITEKYIAGENITAYQPVVIDNGELFVADSSDENHTGKFIGLALNSGLLGSEVKVIRDGSVTNAGWSFATGSFIFLGANGLLVEADPNTEFTQSIGHALNANTIILNIKQAIRRI